MKKSFLVLLITLSQMTYGQDILTDIPQINTFNIIYSGSTATIFLVHYNHVNYYITARHVFPNNNNKDKVIFDITHDSMSKRIEGTLLVHSNPDIDIAVIEPINKEPFRNAVPLDNRQLVMGDNGFFLGFPLGLHSIDLGKINNGFPFPLIKRAVLSGVRTVKGVVTILLDGHNNPGFSGGPVLFRDRTVPSDQNWYLAGVVSAYINQRNQMKTPFGPMDYDENSGIIIAYGQKHIKEIIDAK